MSDQNGQPETDRNDSSPDLFDISMQEALALTEGMNPKLFAAPPTVPTIRSSTP